MRKIKFLFLLVLFAAGCMTASDNTSCQETTKTVHDTVSVQIIKRDTVRLRDTVRIKDTVMVLIRQPDSTGQIFGIWKAKYKGVQTYSLSSQRDTVDVQTTMIISRPAGQDSLIAIASYSITRQSFLHGVETDASLNGRITGLSDGIASVLASGYANCTWSVAMSASGMAIQEIGANEFLTSAPILFSR